MGEGDSSLSDDESLLRLAFLALAFGLDAFFEAGFFLLVVLAATLAVSFSKFSSSALLEAERADEYGKALAAEYRRRTGIDTAVTICQAAQGAEYL